jgi:phage tail-like protein
MANRANLIDQMPAWLKDQDSTGDWAKFMSILQDTLDTFYAILDSYKEIGNADLVDSEDIVNAMLDGLGNPFDVSVLSLAQKRLLVRVLIDIFKKLGTDDAIRDVVRIFTDRVVTGIIRGSVTGWEIGFHELGDGINPLTFEEPLMFAVINPSREFLIYSFMLELDAAPTATEEAIIKEVLRVVKPAYMHYLGVFGYAPTPTILHWEVGVSEIGLTSDIH